MTNPTSLSRACKQSLQHLELQLVRPAAAPLTNPTSLSDYMAGRSRGGGGGGGEGRKELGALTLAQLKQNINLYSFADLQARAP